MSISKKIIVVALLSLLGEPLVSAADQTTANVPVDSVYYQYLDKLSGMGYVKSLPNGAKPYSRMQLARWVLEAKEAAKERPMAPYLADQMAALEVYVAPEVEALSGGKLADDVRLRGVSVEMAYHHGDAFSYAYHLRRCRGAGHRSLRIIMGTSMAEMAARRFLPRCLAMWRRSWLFLSGGVRPGIRIMTARCLWMRRM